MGLVAWVWPGAAPMARCCEEVVSMMDAGITEPMMQEGNVPEPEVEMVSEFDLFKNELMGWAPIFKLKPKAMISGGLVRQGQ